MVRFYLLIITIWLLSPATAFAQQNDGLSVPGLRSGRRDVSPLGSPEEEMRGRVAIKAAEEAHEESTERAREAAQLAVDIRTAFERNQKLASDDLKKLDRLEKLTRKVRGHVGGSEDKDTPVDLPGELDAATAQLAEMADVLQKNVEKTSRHVVAVSVIDTANEMLDLIRHIRSMKP